MRLRPLVVSLAFATAVPALAQPSRGPAAAPPDPQPPLVLTLDEAVAIAVARSEQIAVAQFGATRARGEQRRARSEWFPQVFASASYDRTLASEFSGLFGGSAGPSCDPFTIRPEAPLVDRVGEIERAIDCGAVGNPFSGSGFGELPFGRENIYRLTLSAAQPLYAGGRLRAGRRLAEAGIEAADLGVAASAAQARLDVTQAFYQAALSDRLVAIAEAVLAQAEATLARVRLGRQAGRQPEFDLLRAQVDRDNQLPSVIRARSDRTLAYLRLKQILELPPSQEVRAVADLDAAALPPPAPFTGAGGGSGAAQPPDRRTVVRQAEAGVRARAEALAIAQAERKPSVGVSSAWTRVGYPDSPWPRADYRTNWTVGVAAQVPLFTGGRIAAAIAIRRAELAASEAELKLVREYAALDSQTAVEAERAARAAWEATAGTVQQAERAYEIAELRYKEGISTQLELADARLLLQQAQANRAVAARDLQVARTRLALLPDLPLAGASAGAAGGGSAGRDPSTQAR